jgi:hypothetical protein
LLLAHYVGKPDSEIANGHFVYGNQRELEGYRKEYESQL